MPTTLEERSIHSLIAEALDRAELPDTAAIAEAVLAEMTPDELRQYAARGVRDYVRAYLASQRQGSGEGAGSNGSARWDAVKADQASGRLDLARFAVFTGRSRKWLLDCNVEDLLGAAEYHREAGDRHHLRAEQFTKLANHLKRQAGAEVVGDLVQSKVAGLLNA